MLVRCIQADKYDVIYTFAVIIRGATDHHTFVAKETARGIMDATLNYDTPVVFGVLTCENTAQVEERINNHIAISGLNLLLAYKNL
jgi:6,7-dimethyl-8-ribityllumazine synthase